MIAEVTAALREEARRVGERRLLTLSGARDACYDAADEALAAADVNRDDATLVGHQEALGLAPVEPAHAGRLLGTTREAIVLDAHDEFSPNALGRVVGAVDGGGLLVLCCPPLDEWPARRDAFAETLAVPPFELGDVTDHFRERFVETLRSHPGIAIVDVDGHRVVRRGLTQPAPRTESQPLSIPAAVAFPHEAYDACRTHDQVTALAAFEALRHPSQAIVVEADRGRGKSSVAGLAAGCLAAAGDDVLVTAPEYRSAREIFVRADALLDALGEHAWTDDSDDPRLLTSHADGAVRFRRPTAVDARDPDALIVDEAAAIGVPLLTDFLDADRVAFTTTIHGYEGTGRGFAVRFRDRLDESDLTVTEISLDEPIRYAAGDPVEVWAFRALLLDARPAVDQLVEDARPETVEYHALDPDGLLVDEHLLREAFGLLVLAHYRTEPDDLARLLDAPNIDVRALLYDGHVASVALCAREGNLSEDLRAHMYEGGRVRGNMLPDVLTSQLRDERAAIPGGVRVMRIATHPAIRSRGLGSTLLDTIRDEFEHDVDWLGTGYGATPDLVSFWDRNDYCAIHLSTTRNETSGEYSVVMLAPLTEAGRDLHDRHAEWFADRIAAALSGPLDDIDPDVVRAALGTVETTVSPSFSERDWRLLVGVAYGPGIVDVDLRPFRRLAVKHLIDPVDPDVLVPAQERLLVVKVLQGRGWHTTAEALSYHSTGECMRALGDAYKPLVDTYGDEIARVERDRYES